MLDFNIVLERAGLDPKTVLIHRHAPTEDVLRRAFPTIITEHPHLLLAYQQIQWKDAQKAMTRATAVAAFFGERGGEATFAGLFDIRGYQAVTYGQTWDMPANQALALHGMERTRSDDEQVLLFDLEANPKFESWIGRLIIRWPPPARSWWRWAGNGNFPIEAIAEESRFIRRMPGWDELVLKWADLRILPSEWKTKLSQWRGIYYIFDTNRKAGYVGSAYGADNILGRWLSYGITGHGGNLLLRQSDPNDLRFSILQRLGPDTDFSSVVEVESRWKMRLHSRDFGLNAN